MSKNWKKDTALFLSSQTISLFGTMLVQYAIMWYITMETQSGVMMTLSVVAGFLPTFFLAPFAGVWADRFDRKKLIIIADLSIAFTTLLAAVFFWMGINAIWILLAMSMIRAFGSAVQSPAVNAFIPQFVPEDKLMRVNGINGSIQSIIMLASPMISGALMTFSPLTSIFMIDVATAILAVGVLLTLKVQPHARALDKSKIDYFKDMKLGVEYVKGHSYLKRFFIFTAVFHILITPVATLTPLQVTRTFGNDIWRLTAIEIAFSIGMLFGGILISSWGGFKNRIHTMGFSTYCVGLVTLGLGFASNFWLYNFLMFVCGIIIPLFNVPATVMIQEKVEPEYMGRVFSVMAMIYSSMMPLSMMVFGPMADVVKIEWILVGTGIAIFLQGFFLTKSKVLIEAGKVSF